jgi:predicted ATPase
LATHTRRFIKNNLLLELTSSKAMSAFAWLLKRHSFMSYSLYMAGATGRGKRWQEQQQRQWQRQRQRQRTWRN